MMWWAVFFVAGVMSPPGTWQRISASIASFCLFLVSTHVQSKSRGSPNAPRVFLVLSTALIIWMGAGIGREAYDVRINSGSASNENSVPVVRVTPSLRRSPEPQTGVSAHPFRLSGMRALLLESLQGGHLSGRSRGLLAALILADRKRLSYRLRETYEYLGIAHFLALSGLHLGIIALPLSKMLAALPVSQGIRNGMLLSFLCCYVAVAGFPPSLVRALALVVAFMIRRSLCLQRDLLRSLVIGCFLVALVDFAVIMKPGFQLSCFAVCGIALIGIPLVTRVDALLPPGVLGRISRFVLFPVLITCSITFFLLPMILGLYKRSSLLAPMMNLMVVIPVTVLLYFGAVYLAVPVAGVRFVISYPINYLSDLLFEIPDAVSQRAHPALYSGDIHPVVYTVGMFFLSLSLAKRCSKRTLVLIVALSCILTSLDIDGSPRGGDVEPIPLRVDHHGVRDMVSLRSRCAFWHSGYGVLCIEDEISRSDAYAIVRELWKRGIRRVGLVIVMPGRLYRQSGLLYLLMRLEVGEVACSPYLLLSGQELKVRLERIGLQVVAVSRGARISLESHVVEFLKPLYPPPSGGSISVEEGAVEFRITVNQGRIEIPKRFPSR